MTYYPLRFPPPSRAVRDVLRTALAPYTEAAGVTVSTKGPAPNPSLPYVQVRADARFRNSVLDGRATVRVAVWHADEGLAESLASLAEGLLLAYEGGSEIRTVTPVMSPLLTDDPETGAPLAFFTVNVRLAPVAITIP